MTVKINTDFRYTKMCVTLQFLKFFLVPKIFKMWYLFPI